MKKLSEISKKIDGQPMFKLLEKVKTLEQQGKNIIHFEIGDPDFPTPKNICDAAIYAMENGYTKYTPASGMMELRAAVCEKLKRDNQLNYNANNICMLIV